MRTRAEGAPEDVVVQASAAALGRASRHAGRVARATESGSPGTRRDATASGVLPRRCGRRVPRTRRGAPPPVPADLDPVCDLKSRLLAEALDGVDQVERASFEL